MNKRIYKDALPINRREALALGFKTYYTGKPCEHRHLSERNTCDKKCRECLKIYRKTSHVLERQAVRLRAARANNPIKYREYSNRWKKSHPEYSAAAREAIARALPSWLSCDHLMDIRNIYLQARGLGPNYHVDHIVPLRGKNVSGLHVPWNLRIIRASDNLKKGNKIIETNS